MQATDFDFFDAYSEGLKLLYMGKAPQAEGCFLAVVRAFHGLAAPGADARENAASASLQLGLINARLGSLAEALWHFERAEALGAKTPESTLKAAFCRFSLGLLEDPGADYQKILEQTPDEPEALIGAGRVAAARGEQDKALKLFGRAYEQGRKAEALVEKAMVLEAAGDAKGAAKALSEALGADPGLHERLLAEADKYLYLGLPRPARFFLRRAEKTAPGNPNLTYAIGYRYAAIGAVGDAERAYRSHLAATPTLMGFRELADLYEKTNRVDEAAETLRRPLENFPDDPRLNRLMALCQLRSGDAKGALARLEKVASAEADELTRAEVLNALGRARDRTGDSAGAWAAFAASKKFLKACQDYHAIDRSGIEGVVEGAKSLDPTALPKAPGQALPGGLKGLVFLVGFYRSGTTLVEQILAGHPDVVTAEERPILDAPMIVIDKLAGGYPKALGGLGEGMLSDLRRLYGLAARNFTGPFEGKILVDKNPLHILHAPLIFSLFPDAKFVFMARHPMAVLLSCLMHNFTLNAANSMMLETGEIANFYGKAMGLWQRAAGAAAPPVHVLRYEDLVADIDAEGRRLAEFLAIDWRPEMREFHATAAARPRINTASYNQVIKPLYASSAEAWRRYEKELGRYRAELAPFIERLGYSS